MWERLLKFRLLTLLLFESDEKLKGNMMRHETLNVLKNLEGN